MVSTHTHIFNTIIVQKKSPCSYFSMAYQPAHKCFVNYTYVYFPLIMTYLDMCFCQAISLREMEDRAALEEKLGRALSKQETSRIGVSSLKLFLEELLQKRY